MLLVSEAVENAFESDVQAEAPSPMLQSIRLGGQLASCVANCGCKASMTMAAIWETSTHGMCCAIAMSRWAGRKHCKISSAASPINRKGHGRSDPTGRISSPATVCKLEIITSQWESNTSCSSHFLTCLKRDFLRQILQNWCVEKSIFSFGVLSWHRTPSNSKQILYNRCWTIGNTPLMID